MGFVMWVFIHLFTFQTPIIYDNSALQAELLIYKGDLSVKSNSYLITLTLSPDNNSLICGPIRGHIINGLIIRGMSSDFSQQTPESGVCLGKELKMPTRWGRHLKC
jgi:hypothetical protein